MPWMLIYMDKIRVDETKRKNPILAHKHALVYSLARLLSGPHWTQRCVVFSEFRRSGINQDCSVRCRRRFSSPLWGPGACEWWASLLPLASLTQFNTVNNVPLNTHTHYREQREEENAREKTQARLELKNRSFPPTFTWAELLSPGGVKEPWFHPVQPGTNG